jgi:hypothetical protein
MTLILAFEIVRLNVASTFPIIDFPHHHVFESAGPQNTAMARIQAEPNVAQFLGPPLLREN